MNLDALNSAPAIPTLQAAYHVIDSLQDRAPEVEVMALTLLFHETCGALRLDISEMLDKARRMARTADFQGLPEIAALRNYITKEMA